MKKNRTIACLAALFVAIAGYAQVTPKILGDRHAMLRLDSQKKYILLPVEEKMENAHIRVVRDNETGEVRLDVGKKLFGRGAYICKKADCIHKAEKKRGIERHFKCAVPKELYKTAEELI